MAKTRFLRASEDVEVKVLEANEGLNKVEQANLSSVMSGVDLKMDWKLPNFDKIRVVTFVKKGPNYNLADLKTLTDPAVLYRLPSGFPLMDYYNPPNNCFSLGVGEHKINMRHALNLCNSVAPNQVNFVYVTPFRNYNNMKRLQSFDTGNDGIKILGRLPTETISILSRMLQRCMRFKKE